MTGITDLKKDDILLMIDGNVVIYQEQKRLPDGGGIELVVLPLIGLTELHYTADRLDEKLKTSQDVWFAFQKKQLHLYHAHSRMRDLI